MRKLRLWKVKQPMPCPASKGWGRWGTTQTQSCLCSLLSSHNTRINWRRPYSLLLARQFIFLSASSGTWVHQLLSLLSLLHLQTCFLPWLLLFYIRMCVSLLSPQIMCLLNLAFSTHHHSFLPYSIFSPTATGLLSPSSLVQQSPVIWPHHFQQEPSSASFIQ